MAGKRANLVTRMTLDTKGFALGLRRAAGMVKAFGVGMLKLGVHVLGVRAAVTALKIATAGVVAGMAIGLKKALDLGGRMSDVAEQTGLSVENIVIWEEALRQGGQAAESFGNIVNKMQKSINDFGKGLSTQKDAFKALGISFEDIVNLAPDQQLKLIETRLKGIANESRRVGTARDIFGRQGSKLFSTFGDENALEKARAALGSQVEILNRQAVAFDRISDIIGGIGIKIRSFFVGIADTLLPVLSKVAEAWDKIDLAGAGRQFGHWIGEAIKNFKQLPAIIWAGLQVVIAKFIGLLVEGFKLVGSFLLSALTKIAQFFGDTIKDALNPFKKGAGVESLEDRFKKDGGFTFTLTGDKAMENFMELMRKVFTKVGAPVPGDIVHQGAGRALKEPPNTVRNSALDYTVAARRAIIARDGGKAPGGFNRGTDRVLTDPKTGAGVFGGKGFDFFKEPLKIGNLGKKLDIFAKAPDAATRGRNRARIAQKGEDEKQTALLRDAKKAQAKEMEILIKNAETMERIELGLGLNLGALA